VYVTFFITSVTIQSGRARLVMANIPAAVNRVPEIIDNLSIFRTTTITLHHISKKGSCFEAKAKLLQDRLEQMCQFLDYQWSVGTWLSSSLLLKLSWLITTNIFVDFFNMKIEETVIRKIFYFLFKVNLAVNAEIWCCTQKFTLNLLRNNVCLFGLRNIIQLWYL
jgi:hypothetical protein